MEWVKFRAWYEDDKKMVFLKGKQKRGEVVSSGGKTQQPVFMQYTGFKDGSGNEIYESDVIYDTKRDYTFIVSHGPDLNLDVKRLPHLKIIGNAYENPELFTEWGE